MSFFGKARRAFAAAMAIEHHVYRLDHKLDRKSDEMRLLQGRTLCALNRQRAAGPLQDYEFKVFSQWGEDGIIQRLLQCIEVPNRTFIEFGVEDFSESNCRFLLMNDNWQGMVLDGSDENMARLRTSWYYWMYDLQSRPAFITRENVNELLASAGFARDLGLLSIDVDGMDYWLLDAVDCVQARILIVEYNALFGSERAITVPYDAAFDRTRAHHSNLYFGASLAALAHVATRKGYRLVGTNSIGGNAFFVREDLAHDSLPTLTPQEAYTPSRVRESRDENGALNFLRGAERLECIRGLPVVDVLSGRTEAL